MPRVKCPGCDRLISLKENHFGRKLQCKCGQVFRAPKKMPDQAPQISAPQVSAPPIAPEPIQFSCPTCMTTLQVAQEQAGKLAACPCGAHIPVPLVSEQPLGLAASDPFGFPASNQVGLHSMPLPSSIPPPMSQAPLQSASTTPQRKKKKRPAKVSQQGGNSIFEGEILGGIAMMVGAVVWFVAGLACGYIFFYPPILFLVGLGSLIKGLID